MSQVRMYVMGNDTKWVERITELPFFPFHGLDFQGIAADQPLRVNSVLYDITDLENPFFKIRLSWLSQQPLTSKQMVDLGVGWQIKE